MRWNRVKLAPDVWWTGESKSSTYQDIHHTSWHRVGPVALQWVNSLRSRGDSNLVNQGTEKKMLPSVNSYVDICMFVSSRYGFLRSVDQKRAVGGWWEFNQNYQYVLPTRPVTGRFQRAAKASALHWPAAKGSASPSGRVWCVSALGRLGKNWPKHHQHHHPQNTSSIKNTSV